MNENQMGSGSLLDTTDCLEAVGVFKGWKNFFFVVAVICIAILQACFWLVDLGMIPISPAGTGQTPAVTPNTPVPGSSPAAAPNEPNKPANPAVLPAPNETAAPEANRPAPNPLTAEPNLPGRPSQLAEPNQVAGSMGGPVLLSAQTTVASPNEPSTQGKKEFLFGVTFEHVIWIIRFVNAILILIAFLYCLTMLFSLTVSMLGRLGGVNHITRAFFLSLIALILVLPWQTVFDNTVMGAIFTSGEIVKWQAEKTGDMLDMVLYYLRFCGYMVVVLFFFVMAQVRSSRWAKAILRRLEII